MAPVETISAGTKLREGLNLTSFDLAELTVKIVDEFDIDIFEDGLVSTVGEIFANDAIIVVKGSIILSGKPT